MTSSATFALNLLHAAGARMTGMTKQTPVPILDPISTVARLALLAFQQEGTKLAFHAFDFSFQEPGMSQTLERTLAGRSEEQLIYLSVPIRSFIKWYLQSSLEEKEHLKEKGHLSKRSKRLIEITEIAKRGLSILNTTYKDSPGVAERIEAYITALTEAKTNGQPDNPHLWLFEWNGEVRWNKTEIKQIATAIKLCEQYYKTTQTEKLSATINAIQLYLKGKEQDMPRILHNPSGLRTRGQIEAAFAITSHSHSSKSSSNKDVLALQQPALANSAVSENGSPLAPLPVAAPTLEASPRSLAFQGSRRHLAPTLLASLTEEASWTPFAKRADHRS